MSMSSRTRYSLVALFLFVVVAVVLLVWNQRDTDEVIGKESPISQGEVTPESEDVEEVAEESPQETMEPAKRIEHGPSGEAPKRKHFVLTTGFPSTEPNSTLSDHTKADLLKALNGDFEAAVTFFRAKTLCKHVAKSEAELEALINEKNGDARSMREHGQIIPFDDPKASGPPGRMYFSSETKNRTYQTQWYNSCRDALDIYNDKLRSQLDDLAEKGDVMARYLYAIWGVPVSFAPDSLDTQLEWGSKAFDYSLANLLEGHPAGLLAFGQSYQQGLFTQQESRFGAALMTAALECGLDSAFVQRLVASYDHDYGPEDDPKLIAMRKEFLDQVGSLTSYCR